jgi:hypothetical protein
MAGVACVTRQMSAIVGPSPWQNWPLAGCSVSFDVAEVLTGLTVGIAQGHGPIACLRDRFVMRRVYTFEVECALKFIVN